MSQPRSRLTFSLRDVLWFTVVVALATAWYARERNLIIASDIRLELIKELLITKQQLAAERLSGLQAEKAQLEDSIQQRKDELLEAEAHLEELRAANRALAADSAAKKSNVESEK